MSYFVAVWAWIPVLESMHSQISECPLPIFLTMRIDNCGISGLAAHSLGVYFWSCLNSRFLSGIVTSLFMYLLIPVTSLPPPLILGPGPLPALFHPPPVAPPDWASSSDVDNSSVKGILRGWNNRVREYALTEYAVNSRLRSTGARPSSSLSPEFFVQSLDKLIFIW